MLDSPATSESYQIKIKMRERKKERGEGEKADERKMYLREKVQVGQREKFVADREKFKRERN